MQFIDPAALEKAQYRTFRATKPYPWVSLENVFQEDAFTSLLRDLPDVGKFDKRFGYLRGNGQKSHDRYSLQYEAGVAVPDIWRDFVEELNGREYIGFLEELFRARDIYLDVYWYYTPAGCSVSPHCDHLNKLGAQIFYLNDETDWDEDWGGQTLILDDQRRMSRKSAPEFGDFHAEHAPPTTGNRSLIFARTRHSWHGVREITCPEGRLRKILLATIKSASRWEILRRRYDWW